MRTNWALIGFLVSQAVALAAIPGNEEAVADIDDASNLKPTPTIPLYGTEADPSIYPRREGGGGGGKAKKAAGGGGGHKAGGGQGGQPKPKKVGGGGGGQANKVAAGNNLAKVAKQNNNNKKEGEPYPKGRWTSSKYCYEKTGSLGNTYATLCAAPGKSPVNIHPAKNSPKPSNPPKPKTNSDRKTKKCSPKTMANGVAYTTTCSWVS